MIQELNFILGLDLLRKTRQTEYVWSRYACFYLLDMYKYPIPEIAIIFKMNIATVMYGIEQFKTKLAYGDKTAMGLWNKIKVFFAELDKGGGI